VNPERGRIRGWPPQHS